nr:uncharacterized protein LOC113735472 [Coffea arabica]
MAAQKRIEAILEGMFPESPPPPPSNPSLIIAIIIIYIITAPLLPPPPGSSGSVQAPFCRPWDRDDLFRRLSTFKSMTWFAKPQTGITSLHTKSSGWRGSLKFSSMVLKSSLNCRRTLRGIEDGNTESMCYPKACFS